MNRTSASAAAASAPVLEMRAVSRLHATEAGPVHALGPVDLHLAPGEFVALMGPSGSGKSTLLSLAGGLDEPTSGRVLLDGRDLSRLDARELATLRRRQIGFVFQDLNLLPGLTAIENAALPLELDGVARRDAEERAREQLEAVGMSELTERFPSALSGGEQQRVAIARAFVGDRRLLLADEPTGALDSVTGEGVLRLLRAQCTAGRSVLLVTHDASHAAWADRVLRLRDGVFEGTGSTVAATLESGSST